MQERHLRHRTVPDCNVHELLQENARPDTNLNWLTELEQQLEFIGPLLRGEHLYRAAEHATEVFMVDSGCFKLYAYDPAGREYIHGFRLRGSLIGLHGLSSGIHEFNAMALTDSVVCRLDTHKLVDLAKVKPEFLNYFLHMVGREIVSNVFLSGNFSAEERVASFLVSFSRKLRASFDDPELRLPMSRGDIATYLRLTLPTVSRILSKFKQNGIINSDYHHIQIVDHDRIMQLCKNVPLGEF